MANSNNLVPGAMARTINKAHRMQVLQFLLSVGFSFTKTIEAWLGTSATPRLLRDMVTDGLIRGETVWTLKDKHAYMLTKAGLAAVCESLSKEPHAYELNPHRMVRGALARHQYATHRYMVALAPRPVEIVPDRHWLAQPKAGVKRPDLITVDSAARAVAHEVELTLKKGRELDRTLALHLQALESGRYAEVVYVSPTAWLLEAYARVLTHPDGIHFWHKTAQGRWEPFKRVHVPKSLVTAFRWVHRPSLTKGL